ncbi:MAG: sugar transferase [Planctomycetes bacterium]|nr:sugar transferase [Planctomycetota bacterium]
MPEPVTILTGGSGFVAVLIYLARRYFDLAKEVVDIILGSIALILCLPLLVICALIIKISSKGPVIYTQVRLGKDGVPFKMYKLRTMYVNAESATGPIWAKDGDPRIIPACRWMRKSHIDELPQLINVIKGDMSLVVPRPERPEIMEELKKVYPEVVERLRVRPGITGLAQIRYGYDTDVKAYKRKLEADLEYVEQRKWVLELKIMLETFAKLNDKMAR